MANGKLEIEGLDELIAKVKDLQKELSLSVESLGDMVKAVNKASDAELKNAKTLTEVAKAKAIEQKMEEESAIRKEKLIQTTNKTVEQAKKLAEATSKLTQEQKLQIQINNAEQGSYEQLDAQYKLNIISLKRMGDTKREQTEEGKKLVAETAELNKKLKDLDATVGNYQRNVADYPKTTQSMRQEMKLLTVQIAEAKLAHQENTPEIIKAKQRLGELRDTMADVAAEAKVLGSDTRNIDMFVGSIQAVGAAGQLLESGLQAIGVGNEDLGKNIQKLMIIQSAMNAAQELGNALQKESTFMLGLHAVQSKVAAAGQAIYATAVGTSTGAMKAFRVALLATGIGAIIVGIGLLVTNWDKLSKAIFNSTNNLDLFNKANEKFKMEADIKNKKIQDEIDLLKAKGAKEEEVYKKERELMTTNIDMANKMLEENRKLQETAAGKDLIALKNKEQSLINSLAEQQRLLILFDETERTRREDEEEKLQKERDEKHKKLLEDKLKKEEEINNLILEADKEARQNRADWDKTFEDDVNSAELETQKIMNQAVLDEMNAQYNAMNLAETEQYNKELAAAGNNIALVEKADKDHKYRMLQNEIAYNQLILSTYEKGSNEYLAAERRLADISLQIQQDTTDQILYDEEKRAAMLKQMKEMAAATYLDFTASIGQATAALMYSQDEMAKQIIRNAVKGALQGLKALTYIWIGQAITGSMASLQSIATAGVAGAIQAGALTVAIETAYAAAELGVNSMIDQFAKGTDDAPGGLAFVGERGRELITLPNGKMFLTPDNATLVNLPKHSEVTPNHLVEQELLKAVNRPEVTDKKDNMLMLELINTIKNKQSVNFSIDRNGIGVISKKGLNTTKWLNNRYRGNA